MHDQSPDPLRQSRTEASVDYGGKSARATDKKRGLSGVAADEPDRAGMLRAVFFVLSTLLAVTVALGYVTFIG